MCRERGSYICGKILRTSAEVQLCTRRLCARQLCARQLSLQYEAPVCEAATVWYEDGAEPVCEAELVCTRHLCARQLRYEAPVCEAAIMYVRTRRGACVRGTCLTVCALPAVC
jgi:hypothetical protein